MAEYPDRIRIIGDRIEVGGVPLAYIRKDAPTALLWTLDAILADADLVNTGEGVTIPASQAYRLTKVAHDLGAVLEEMEDTDGGPMHLLKQFDFSDETPNPLAMLREAHEHIGRLSKALDEIAEAIEI